MAGLSREVLVSTVQRLAHGDMDHAARMLQQVGDEHGEPGAVAFLAAVAACAVQAQAVMRGGHATNVHIIGDIDEVPPVARAALRFVAAAANSDADTVQAVFATLPDEDERHRFAAHVLLMARQGLWHPCDKQPDTERHGPLPTPEDPTA